MSGSGPIVHPRCDGVSRRDFLHLGLLTTFGVSVADLLCLQAEAAVTPPATAGQATSCILLWLDGGPSHLDTFDPKPDAPESVRGEFKPIATAVPGIQICERFPQLA